MDLERSQIDAERQRAAEAFRAELRRQAADRALGQLRLVAVMAFVICMVSVGVGVWLPGMSTLLPRVLMGIGLALAIAALGCAFAAWQQVSAWSADPEAAGPGSGRQSAALVAPWLLLSSLAVIGAAFLSAL
jgi:protein-S-isoprenylcysteine O-methyltransferase Ste14